MNIADSLTLLRLALVPFFLWRFLVGDYELAFILFVIAGLTDLVDGTIARVLKQQTRFGALLDPIADKALMVTTFACLLYLRIVPWWFFALLAIRDVAILSGLAYLQCKKIKVELKPVYASKLATLTNIFLVIFGFLQFFYPAHIFLMRSFLFWFEATLALATTLVLLSAIQYFWIGVKILRRRKML